MVHCLIPTSLSTNRLCFMDSTGKLGYLLSAVHLSRAFCYMKIILIHTFTEPGTLCQFCHFCVEDSYIVQRKTLDVKKVKIHSLTFPTTTTTTTTTTNTVSAVCTSPDRVVCSDSPIPPAGTNCIKAVLVSATTQCNFEA